MKIQKIKAFTLIEMMTSILIVAIILLWAFQAMTSLGFWKIRLMQKTATQKQMLYFSEKLFEMIKYWGTIDFEEYFNRKVVNQSPLDNFWSGHYIKPTWFWNYWPNSIPWTAIFDNEYYYCLSWNWDPMGTNGCVSANNTTDITGITNPVNDFSWEPQTYGQYSFQFRDYNSNQDTDNWDEDGNNLIVWDDDDNYFGKWPNVFATGAQVQELYLINGVKRQRTFFRYNVWLDPYAPPGSTCTSSDSWKNYTGTGCLWNIEYLIMDGRDWWLDHTSWNSDSTENDWVIDTWLVSEKFTGNQTTIAGRNNPVDWYWQPLFPENIHVTEFSIFPHPNIDEDRAWAITDEQVNVSQYVRIHVWMMPAWRERRLLKGEPREYKYSTTINLTDIFSR